MACLKIHNDTILLCTGTGYPHFKKNTRLYVTWVTFLPLTGQQFSTPPNFKVCVRCTALQNLPYTKPNVMENFEVFRWNIFLSTNSEIGGSVNLWPHGWLSKKNNNLDLFCIPAEECIQISKYYKFFFQKKSSFGCSSWLFFWVVCVLFLKKIAPQQLSTLLYMNLVIACSKKYLLFDSKNYM